MKLLRFPEVRYFRSVVGDEVDFSLVRASPVASLIRGVWMTLTGAKDRLVLEHAS